MRVVISICVCCAIAVKIVVVIIIHLVWMGLCCDLLFSGAVIVVWALGRCFSTLSRVNVLLALVEIDEQVRFSPIFFRIHSNFASLPVYFSRVQYFHE